MKSLQTIQKTFRVFQTLSKIAMVLSFVWAGLAALGLLCGVLWYSGGNVFGVNQELLYSLTVTGGLTEMIGVLLVDMILALTDGTLLVFAVRYFKAEQADGSPFTQQGADRVLHLGILNIVLPLVAAILSALVCELLTQKLLVNLTDKLALREAQAAIEKIEKDMAAADAVTDKINALPAAEDVTLDDTNAIMDAIAAYQLLTDDQKAYVDDETVEKLNAAEDALIQAAKDAIAAEVVKQQINALPDVEDLTYDDKDDVEAARAAYDALTDAQKALIDEDTYKKLTDAEARMNRFVLLGDANGDGRINIKDITAIQRHLAEITLLDELGELAADVNRDGNVTIEDVTALQSYLAEYEVEYPIGEMV